MKNIKTIVYLTLLIGISLFSCSNDETKVTFTGTSTAPVLTASSTADLVLTKATQNYSSLQFQWTNPNYEFSNGVSTQDVSYTLQIDTTGSNFTNPKMVKLSYTKDVFHSFTVKELNTTLSGLELADNIGHNFEFRILATLNGNAPQYSNVVKVKITTYLDVVYTVPAKLFITGSATAKGWMSGGDAAVTSQQFTKTNSYQFVLTGVALNGGQEFLLVPVYGDWNNKYGTVGANDTNNPSGDAFTPGGNNFLAPSTSGTYTVTVNFKTGKYSVQ